MTTRLQRKIGAAMAAQVERVNNSPEALQDRADRAWKEAARLREQLLEQARTITALRNRIAMMEMRRTSQLIPVSQAARRSGRSISTINRHLNGKVKHPEFHGIRVNKTWLVYANANGDPVTPVDATESPE